MRKDESKPVPVKLAKNSFTFLLSNEFANVKLQSFEIPEHNEKIKKQNTIHLKTIIQKIDEETRGRKVKFKANGLYRNELGVEHLSYFNTSGKITRLYFLEKYSAGLREHSRGTEDYHHLTFDIRVEIILFEDIYINRRLEHKCGDKIDHLLTYNVRLNPNLKSPILKIINSELEIYFQE